MLNEDLLEQAAIDPRCCLAIEPNLMELLNDPLTVALMAADHVDRRELDLLLADASVAYRQ
jgi:hypothetical protein